MELKCDSFDIKINGFNGCIKILQVSDLHLTEYFDDDLPDAIAEMPGRKELFDKETDYRYNRAELLLRYFKFAEKSGCDYILFTGDIIDAPTKANIKLLSDAVKNSSVKAIFTFGNHDWTFTRDYGSREQYSSSYPLFADIFGEKIIDDEGIVHIEWNSDSEVYDFGEFVLFCADNSTEQYSEESLEKLKYFTENKIPVIICSHIPFSCEGNHEDVVKMWGRDISIGSADLVHTPSTREFADIIYSKDSPVVAVIAGHNHQNHIDRLSEENETVQYILAPSYNGNIRLFNIFGS